MMTGRGPGARQNYLPPNLLVGFKLELTSATSNQLQLQSPNEQRLLYPPTTSSGHIPFSLPSSAPLTTS